MKDHLREGGMKYRRPFADKSLDNSSFYNSNGIISWVSFEACAGVFWNFAAGSNSYPMWVRGSNSEVCCILIESHVDTIIET